MSDTKMDANHPNAPDEAAGGGIRNDLAKAYQQSVDILSSLVDNLLTAGIIDFTDHSYTVLKDMTGKTVMNARHPYADFFYAWMKPFILEESAEGLRLANLSYLEAQLTENKRVSQDYHIIDGMWLRCTWTPFRDHNGESRRILLYSADVTGEYEGNAQLAAQLQEREAIIQGLGDVYYSVLLVDYQHDHVTVSATKTRTAGRSPISSRDATSVGPRGLRSIARTWRLKTPAKPSKKRWLLKTLKKQKMVFR